MCVGVRRAIYVLAVTTALLGCGRRSGVVAQPTASTTVRTHTPTPSSTLTPPAKQPIQVSIVTDPAALRALEAKGLGLQTLIGAAAYESMALVLEADLERLRRSDPAAGVGVKRFAHRLFDLVPATLLVVWVLLTADVPHWAVVALMIVAAVGLALFTVAWMSAKRHDRPVIGEGVGSVRHLLGMARLGLTVLKAPLPLLGAVLLQCLGWLLQLLAVYVAMQAFGIDAPLPAAGLVLVLMNIATIVPLWPGNVGLVQAAVAVPLRNYGVPYSTGFAYGLALQALEMACGVGLGLIALAREGISLAMLRRMQEDEAPSPENAVEEVHELIADLEPEADAAREGAPLSGLPRPGPGGARGPAARERRARPRVAGGPGPSLSRPHLGRGHHARARARASRDAAAARRRARRGGRCARAAGRRDR